MLPMDKKITVYYTDTVSKHQNDPEDFFLPIQSDVKPTIMSNKSLVYNCII
jgi:hypothetical protein